MLRFTARKLIPHVDEMVELKNKTQVPSSAVSATMKKLTKLLSSHSVAFDFLVIKCRNSKFEIDGELLDLFKNLGLINHDGSINEITKNIILSAIIDDGWDINLGSPFADDLTSTTTIRSKL